MTKPCLLEVCALDRADVGHAIAAAAEKVEKRALPLKLGVGRDNMMARAIRLKRMAEALLAPPDDG